MISAKEARQQLEARRSVDQEQRKSIIIKEVAQKVCDEVIDDHIKKAIELDKEDLWYDSDALREYIDQYASRYPSQGNRYKPELCYEITGNIITNLRESGYTVETDMNDPDAEDDGSVCYLRISW